MDDQHGPVGYWAPPAGLTGYITAFHRFRVPDVPGGYRDILLPSPATIRIALHDGARWSTRIGNRVFDNVPDLAFMGPTSQAGQVAVEGSGTLIGVGLRPAGWAQLFGGDLSRHANRVVPLAMLDGGGEALRDALAAAEAAGDTPVAAFAAWLETRLQRRPPADPRVALLTQLLDDPATTRIEAVAEALETTPRALTTLTRATFGFTPKVLLRRNRFLRALSAILIDPASGAEALEAAGYWDRSHFLRDSHLFLGCSVRDFVRQRGPMNQLAIQRRVDALGEAV